MRFSRRSKRVRSDAEIELALEFAGVAEVERVVGEESRVGVGAECGVDDAHDQGERGYGGVEIQIVDARDWLVFLGRISVRALGLDLDAIDEDFGTESGRAKFDATLPCETGSSMSSASGP